MTNMEATQLISNRIHKKCPEARRYVDEGVVLGVGRDLFIAVPSETPMIIFQSLNKALEDLYLDGFEGILTIYRGLNQQITQESIRSLVNPRLVQLTERAKEEFNSTLKVLQDAVGYLFLFSKEVSKEYLASLKEALKPIENSEDFHRFVIQNGKDSGFESFEFNPSKGSTAQLSTDITDRARDRGAPITQNDITDIRILVNKKDLTIDELLEGMDRIGASDA